MLKCFERIKLYFESRNNWKAKINEPLKVTVISPKAKKVSKTSHD